MMDKETSIVESSDQLHLMIEYAPMGAILLDNHTIMLANEKMAIILDAQDKQSLIKKSLLEYIHPSYLNYFTNWLDQIHSSHQPLQCIELILIKNDNAPIHVKVHGSIFYYQENRLIQLFVDNITELKQREIEINYLANSELYTKQMNHLFLDRHINQAIVTAKKNKSHFAIVDIRLNRFKLVHERYGYKISNLLLQAVLERLKKAALQSDSILTIGESEFIVIIQNIENIHTMTHLIKKYTNAFSKPFMIDQHEIMTTAVLGISLYPENGVDSETLIKQAELACYYANQQERSHYQFFTPSMAYNFKQRADLLHDLHHALPNNELVLFYQPIVDIKKRKIISLEALLRWNRSNKEMLLPADFLTLAEEADLIFEISDWVIKTVCNQLFEWQEIGMTPLPISINLSTRPFHIKSYLRNTLDAILRDIPISPRLLEFEMSENVTTLDIGFDILDPLKEMGIKLTVDHFGASYFSLNELKRYRIDNIKIDRTLVTAIPDNVDETTIVTAIIAMAEKLAINVIAEGVEAKEQLNFLTKNNCYQVQGNYICPPLTAEKLLPILKKSERIQLTEFFADETL